MRRKLSPAGLFGAWLCASGFAPAGDGPRVPYDLTDLLGREPGETRPMDVHDPAAAARQARRNGSYLTLDLSVAADSNFTNQTGLHAVEVITDGETIPVMIGPEYRERQGIGQGASVTGGLRLPLAGGISAAVDAEAQLSNYRGTIGDDVAVLLAFGPEITFDASSQGALQAIAYERWYGGTVASRGVGVRGRYQQGLGEQGRVYLFMDARVFESGYGEDFGGTQASAYLTYEELLNPALSLSTSIYGRRERLGSDAFSNYDLGAYGGLSAFLPLQLKGGFSAGVSRILFDGPLVYYSPNARRDWRYTGSIWLMPREAFGPGLWPSISYTYSRTDSSLPFYSSGRHRVRAGVARYW